MIRGQAVLLIALVTLGGCTREQVIVEVSTDTETAAAVTWLRAVVYDDRGDEVQRWTASVGADKDITLANRIILEPDGGDVNRRWGVSVEVFSGASAPAEDAVGIARQQAFGRYVKGETVSVVLELDPSCPRCADGQSCFQGECVGGCLDLSEESPRPLCGECEVCELDTCVPQPDGASCGCDGDSCRSGSCTVSSPVRELATGRYATCVTVRERVLCFGENGDDRIFPGMDVLESPTEVGSFPAVQFFGLELGGAAVGADPLASPAMGCVIGNGPAGQAPLPNTELKCFGRAAPRLELPGTGFRRAFPSVENPDDLAVSVGHICVLAAGMLWCAGNDGQGRLGNGPAGSAPHTEPFMVPSQSSGAKWLDVGVGHLHTCAVDDQGAVWCWGSNANGELGNGTSASEMAPVRVLLNDIVPPARPIEVELGEFHSCALASDGEAYCWGGSSFGNVGQGIEDRGTRVPGRVLSPKPLKQLACGRSHCCALARDTEEIFCWGANQNGQIGQPPDDEAHATPESIDIARSWAEVRAGENHTCALRSGGALYCWGGNAYFQLGLPDGRDRDYPTRVCF